LGTLFRELPLRDRFEAARSRGFDGAEIQSPYSESAESLAYAARAAALPVVLINSPAVPSAHPFGIAGCPGMEALYRTQLAQVREYAEALGARFVHILAGCPSAGAPRDRCLAVYEQNLDLAADELRPAGIEVLIEPLNSYDAPGYLLDSFELALSVLARRGPGVGLQFDAYHATRMGLDLTGALLHAMPHVRHVQFADAPGRHQPGTGRVAFREMLSALRSARYSGWLGAEYFPSGSTDESLAWLAEWRAVD
jgi:hydroxypyruvate isomerase